MAVFTADSTSHCQAGLGGPAIRVKFVVSRMVRVNLGSGVGNDITGCSRPLQNSEIQILLSNNKSESQESKSELCITFQHILSITANCDQSLSQ